MPDCGGILVDPERRRPTVTLDTQVSDARKANPDLAWIRHDSDDFGWRLFGSSTQATTWQAVKKQSASSAMDGRVDEASA
jgi:hypothetical protein